MTSNVQGELEKFLANLEQSLGEWAEAAPDEVVSGSADGEELTREQLYVAVKERSDRGMALAQAWLKLAQRSVLKGSSAPAERFDLDDV